MRLFTSYQAKMFISLLAIILIFASFPVFAASEDINHGKFKTSSIQSVAFSDVKTTDWFYGHLDWGVKNGLVTGYTDGTFKPQNNVKENEFLAMLVRSYADKGVKAVNGQGGSWADDYYRVAKELGYYVFGNIDTYDRNLEIDRGRVAMIIATSLVEYNGVGSDEEGTVQFLFDNKLADGKVKNGVKDFYADDKLTRAEAIAFIDKLHKALANGNVTVKTVKASADPKFVELQNKVEELGFTVKKGEGTHEGQTYIKDGRMDMVLYWESIDELIITSSDKPEVVEAARLLFEYAKGITLDKETFAKAVVDAGGMKALETTLTVNGKKVKIIPMTMLYNVKVVTE